MEREKPIRAFLAVKLPGTIAGALSGLQQRLVDSGVRMRWVRPENIHLTIRFLGDIPARSVDPVRLCLAAASKPVNPMKLVVQGLGAFPGIKRARVVWVGIGGETGRLSVFYDRLGRELEKLGFVPERRRFTPHLTLGRIKKTIPPDMLVRAIGEFGMFAALPFTARRVYFIKSELTKKGPVYSDLGSAGFESPATGDSLEV